MEIRKVSIGPDYKSGSMHYVVGQELKNDKYTIHAIRQNTDGSVDIWVINKKKEVIQWKHITATTPMVLEANLEFL